MIRNYLITSAVLVPAFLLVSACSNTRTANNTNTSTDTTTEGTRARTADNTKGTAYVRFVDGHTGNSDLFFGDEKAFTGVADHQVTDYKPMPAERREFRLRDSANAAEKPLATNSEGLGTGKYYTVIAFDDKSGNPSLRVVNDDEKAPDSGKAAVRIIHAAPGMDSVSLDAGNHKIAGESMFSSASTWQQVDPVKGPLEIRTGDKKENPIVIPRVTLEPGRLYTFVVMGGQKAHERLRVIPIVDRPQAS